MATVDATVVVQLVNHDKLQILKDLSPFCVVGQDPGVEHIGVGENHVRPLPNRPPRVLRGVAVVGEGADFGGFPVHPDGIDRCLELLQLVLGEGLGGE